MPDFKAYLRNFSKTLGILKSLGESVSYNFSQAENEVVAPFDGFMQISVRCTSYWVNVSISGREAPVMSLQSSSVRTDLSGTIPIKKGETYHIWTDWQSERYNVTLFPLMNTN